MKTEKLYFKSINDNTCYDLQTHIEDAKDEELSEIKLIEAIPDNDNPENIWCSYHGEVGERQECKKSVCEYYKSKSGRGKCEHRGNLFSFGEEVTFKVE